MNSKKFFVVLLLSTTGILFLVVLVGLYLDNSVSVDSVVSIAVGAFAIAMIPSSIGSMLHLWLSRRKIK